MNRGTSLRLFVLPVLFVVSALSSQQVEAEPSGLFTHMESVVPGTEKYIHIGGGFFSHFNNRPGSVTRAYDMQSGSICFTLEHMEWESPFVYLPQGNFTMTVNSDTDITLHMDRLDYVIDPSSGRLLYRLAASNPDCTAVLIGDCDNPGFESRPVLQGELHVIHNGEVSVSTFRICGRNETEAERHLNRVVYLRSDFTDSL